MNLEYSIRCVKVREADSRAERDRNMDAGKNLVGDQLVEAIDHKDKNKE